MIKICLNDVEMIVLLVTLTAGAWLAGRAHERHQRPYRLIFVTNRWTKLRYRWGLRWWT